MEIEQAICKYYELYPIRYKQGGSRSTSIIIFENDIAFKIYNDAYSGISYVDEIDITMRLINPGIVRAYKLLTREDIDQLGFNHGLYMKYVFCGLERQINERNKIIYYLKNGLIHTLANLQLLENGYLHTDTGNNNECATTEGFQIIDLNGDDRINYFEYREEPFVFMMVSNLWFSFYSDRSIFKYLRSKDEKMRDYVKPYENNHLPKVANILIDNFLFRVFHKDLSIRLDLYEIPSHPIFKYYNISVEEYGEVPCEIVNYKNEIMYMNIIRDVLDRNKNSISVENVFESIDLFRRFIAAYQGDMNLAHIYISCISLVSKTSFLQHKNQATEYNHQLICKIVKGNLRRRNIYHLIRNVQDLNVCWNLFFKLPYKRYMNISPMNLYKFSHYNGEEISIYSLFSEIEDKIIDMEFDEFEETVFLRKFNIPNYCFSKLTKEEMIEYLELNDCVYNKEANRFVLGDLCHRVFIYTYRERKLTEAVEDLVLLYNWNYEIRFYSREEFPDLAKQIGLKEVDNSRIERILRMSNLDSLLL